MTSTAVSVRALGALSAGLLALGMLAACTPQPDPKPTPTKTAMFSSDAEAFKAAEETYRAYVDASNEVDLADSRTFEAAYAWNTGTALGAEKKALTLYHAEKLTRVGIGTFDTFTPVTATGKSVVAQLCLDSSNVDLVHEDGTSALSMDRPTRAARTVTFTPGPTATGLQIAANQIPDDGFTC